MKTLMISLMILGMAGMALGEFTIGGHNKGQLAVIGLTSAGTVYAARTTVDLLPIKNKTMKAGAKAFATLAGSYALNYLATNYLSKPGVQADRGKMYHAGKDGSMLVAQATFPLFTWDLWRAEKK